MNLQPSEKAQQYLGKLRRFMDEHVYPNEEEMRRQHEALPDRWQVPPLLDELKKKARAAGLWNLFLPESKHGAGLTNLEYAPLAEVTGWSPFLAPEALNSSAPDTGNMELLAEFGTTEQQQQWLVPLLEGCPLYRLDGDGADPDPADDGGPADRADAGED